ncbi:MAG: hypothetical protein V2A79_00165 [Planctomycetota bacterium]
MNSLTLADISAAFTGVDWLIVVAYLALTTWLGARMSGRQATIRDFFLGGRRLPWYAVSGSLIATEISALTFVGVPYVVFKPEGNFTYLQLGVFGSLLARVIVGYVLMPAYYQREIYSPYDYMGHQLGPRVRTMTSALFVLGGMLAQSARVYLTAQVMIVLLHRQLYWLVERFGLDELAWAIILIGVVAVGWTLIGGITTVIWSNVILFGIFLVGALAALGTVAGALGGGFGELLGAAWTAKESGPWGKFTFFDFDPSPLKLYTIWTAVIASTWGGLGAYGTDQLLVQSMFCCRDPRQARRAILGSIFGQVVTVIVMLVGAGLFVYYQAHPLTGEALEIYQKKGDRIFPIFIMQVVPVGLKGLIIAAIMAAAISTVMGILTALSQTVLVAFYLPLRQWYRQRKGPPGAGPSDPPAGLEDRRSVIVSRLLVLLWGAALCAMAYLTDTISHKYPSILDLGLAMAGYAGGALLAGFALAFLPLGIDGRGYMWSAPLSVFYVFALIWHRPWTHAVCWIFAGLLLIGWLGRLMYERRRDYDQPPLVLPAWAQTLVLAAGLGGMLLINYYGYWSGPPDANGHPTHLTVAWPWYSPLGSTVAFALGYLLGRYQPGVRPQPVGRHSFQGRTMSAIR